MSYPIEQKLVIAVASSALFDLSESDRVFRERGEKVYRDYQQQYLNDPLDKGVAFPFVRRFLSINQRFAAEGPVEVGLLSRNSAITGKRVFNSIAHHGLNITRAAFLEGKSPYAYIPSFNASLFLSISKPLAAESPVAVVLRPRHSAITGKRVPHSIAHNGLNPTRAAFLDGKSPNAPIPAINASPLLSPNEPDVLPAIDYGYPAGT